jgi:hypothetical protein
MIKILALFLSASMILDANSEEMTPIFNKGMAYDDVKKDLIANGWKPLQNSKISSSSLYAQELYEQGIVEVVDCVSMELDGCWFRFTKKKQTLEVRTITKQLKIESLNLIKNR